MPRRNQSTARATAAASSTSTFAVARMVSIADAIAAFDSRYAPRMTHSNSTTTLFGTKTASVANARRAALACSASSWTKSRTIRLVSTARMPPPSFLYDRGVHFLDRPGRPLVFQDAGPIIDGELLLLFDGLEQNTIAPLFHGQARPDLPAPLVAKCLRQDDLALARDFGFHRMH